MMIGDRVDDIRRAGVHGVRWVAVNGLWIVDELVAAYPTRIVEAVSELLAWVASEENASNAALVEERRGYLAAATHRTPPLSPVPLDLRDALELMSDSDEGPSGFYALVQSLDPRSNSRA